MANLSASAVRRTKRNSRHGRIYRRRYRLPWDKFLWNKYLSSYLPARRHKALSRRNQLLLELKRECQRKRKFMRETLELKHALMPLERSGRLAASSAPPWRLEHASYASVASRQSRSTSTGTVRTRSVRNVNDYCAVTVASRLKRRLCGIVACALCARPQREGMTASCPSPSRFDGGAASTGRLCWREEGGADAAALQGFQLRFFQTAQPLARSQQ